jgi:acyl carrier protein
MADQIAPADAHRAVEVELERHPGVARAAVVLLGEPPDQQVVAFAEAAGPDGVDDRHLRDHLARGPVGPAVVDVVVPVDRIPLTSDDRPDSAVLSTAGRGPVGAGGTAPTVVGGLVAELADVWREVLEVERVGVADDLFDLGGHSLAITRITVRIRSQLGVDVPLVSFYDTPTVAGIAAVIEEIRRNSRPE